MSLHHSNGLIYQAPQYCYRVYTLFTKIHCLLAAVGYLGEAQMAGLIRSFALIGLPPIHQHCKAAI